MNAAEAGREAGALGFDVPEATAGVLGDYVARLLRWNAVVNLTGAGDERTAFRTLIADSLHLARFLRRPGVLRAEAPSCWDLGAGAGLPGIPLRCVWSEGTYVLVEAREKRALFMRTVLALHPLPGTTVFHGRAERFMPEAAPADLVVSRAFMPWRRLVGFAGPYLAKEGRIVLLLNEPVVAAPDGWMVADAASYDVGGAPRHLAALARASLST